jgi:hypothetical protein
MGEIIGRNGGEKRGKTSGKRKKVPVHFIEESGELHFFIEESGEQESGEQGIMTPTSGHNMWERPHDGWWRGLITYEYEM